MSQSATDTLEADQAALLTSLRTIKPAQSLSDASIEAFYVLAHDALTSGALEAAQSAFGFLSDQRPGEARMWAGLGYSLLESSQFEPAVAAFLFATQLEPDNAGYMMALGRAFAAGELTGHAAYAFGIAEALARGAGDADLADRARGRLELMGVAP